MSCLNNQISIFDGTPQSLLNKSIELIKSFEEVALHRNSLGFVVGYSGGKDSDVLVHLFRRAGVKFCVVHIRNTQGLSNKYNFKTGAEYFDSWLNNEKLSANDEVNLFNFEGLNYD